METKIDGWKVDKEQEYLPSNANQYKRGKW